MEKKIYIDYDEKPRFGRLSIRDARTIYETYFDGHKNQYNIEGKRKFNVLIPPEELDRLETEPWNVSWTKVSEKYPDQQPYLPVEARFDNYPPRIYVIKGNKTLYEMTLEELNRGVLDDRGKIARMNMVISPSVYWDTRNIPNQYKIKAYLSSLYVEFRETEGYQDPFYEEFDVKGFRERENAPEDDYVPFN